jgi:hypothetical protein
VKKALLPLVLLAASCAGWRFVGAEDHAALVPGAQLASYEKGRGVAREHRVEIRVDGSDLAAHSIDEAMPYLRPIDSPKAAIAYAMLVRELGISDAGGGGLEVRPDPKIDGPGGAGRYSKADAAGWGIPFEATARKYAEGYEVSHVVLFPPRQHPTMPQVRSPWRLLLVREVVSPDGTLRQLDTRTLSNGSDAERYAAY